MVNGNKKKKKKKGVGDEEMGGKHLWPVGSGYSVSDRKVEAWLGSAYSGNVRDRSLIVGWVHHSLETCPSSDASAAAVSRRYIDP